MSRGKWICEFCYATPPINLDGRLPGDWALVWQCAICPPCQKRLERDGRLEMKCGAYATIPDPRVKHVTTPDMKIDHTEYQHPISPLKNPVVQRLEELHEELSHIRTYLHDIAGSLKKEGE